jgi:hypothetical protein
MTSHFPAVGASHGSAVQSGVSSPGIPPMSFSVPEAFHALPVADTAEERAQRAAEFVRELFLNGGEEFWELAAPFYADLTETVGGGLAYYAIGVFGIEEGVAHCSFSIAAVDSHHTSTEVAAQGIRAILANDPGNDVRWVDLPCGPAVSCVSVREVTFGPEITKSGEPISFNSGQIQVHVPFPTGPYTAVFTLDTSALKYFGEFCDIAATILRTVSFIETEEPEENEVAAR